MPEPIQAPIQELVQTFHQFLLDPDRLPLAIVAVVLVLLVGMMSGPVAGNANPAFWALVETLFGKLGMRMNKSGRLKGDLIFRGLVFTIMVAVIAFFAGRAMMIAANIYPVWSIVEILALCLVLSAGTVFVALGRLYKALNDKKVSEGAYYTLARSTRTDMSRSDDYTIVRVGMGLVFKSFDKALVAPVIWYLIAGLPGAYIYAGLAALVWRFGAEGHHSGFGAVMMALERLMGFVPNMLSGIYMAFAALVTPTAGLSRSFLGFFSSKGQAKYEEGGFPMSVAVHALNISIGGPTTDLDGVAIKRGWIGPAGATAQLGAKHLHRALYMGFIAHLLFLASLGGAIIFAASGLTLGLF
ncbi:MAG: cobalamin biosynthesis protein [Alphaproteobacteria bacterium]|nr:cobalamin biosynthesis protein [Alphaproteobacteria bacterium]